MHSRIVSRTFSCVLVVVLMTMRVSLAAPADKSWTFSLYFENDLFADSDQHYTNGIKLSWISPDLTRYRDSGKLPAWSQPYIDLLPFIHEPGLQRNITLSVGQNIYTPQDISRKDLIRDDRPYAGWLYFGAAFHNKNPRRLDSMEVQLGLVGPLSFAEQAQTLVHELRGFAKPEGWSHQLKTEPGIALVYERKWRTVLPPRHGLGFDLISHAGGALGNIQTYANAGLEARIGWNLPADFGNSLIRPGGDTNAPVDASDPRRRRHGFGFHLFASVDGRAVARDIFLDGNTFASSHRVDKRNLVADLAAGASLIAGRFKLSFAKVLRTREFRGQAANHRFGSVTLSYTY